MVWGGVFFFKQKAAYDMRISDWSSDVCSSDLLGHRADAHAERRVAHVKMESEHHGHGGGDDEQAQRGDDHAAAVEEDRRCDVLGKSVSVRVDLGGRRIIKNQSQKYIRMPLQSHLNFMCEIHHPTTLSTI